MFLYELCIHQVLYLNLLYSMPLPLMHVFGWIPNRGEKLISSHFASPWQRGVYCWCLDMPGTWKITQIFQSYILVLPRLLCQPTFEFHGFLVEGHVRPQQKQLSSQLVHELACITRSGRLMCVGPIWPRFGVCPSLLQHQSRWRAGCNTFFLKGNRYFLAQF